MSPFRLAALLAVAACGPETTSFRTTDDGDGTGRGAAGYTIRANGRDVATVSVLSNGGYISATDEATTHIAFEIRNTSGRPFAFDSDALHLVVAGKDGAPLPAAVFTTLTPLGAAKVVVPPRATTALDAYFRLPVRPRAIETMRIHWALKLDNARYEQTTSFVRDDAFPVSEPPVSVEPSAPSS